MSLTDYVIMPSADYVAACNKIREKSGKTDPIKSGDLATEIEEVAGGGGGGFDENDELQGVWVFDKVAGESVGNYHVSDWNIDVIANNRLYHRLRICSSDFANGSYDTTKTVEIYFADADDGGDGVRAFYNYAWLENECKTISILSKYDEVENADTLFQALTARASHTLATHIEGYFDGSVTDLILPNVTKIKGYAFNNDTTLIGVSIPNTTTIGNNAFYGCTNLERVKETSKLTYIGSNAFVNCAKLSDISLPSELKTIYTSAFSSCVVLALTELPSGLTSIGQQAFASCKALALTELPSGITTLENSVFSGCTGLTSLSLPSGLTSIGQQAFYNCSNLALTELPSALKTIKSSAFYNCSNLALTSIPSGVTSIDTQAFYNCTGLTSITFKGKPSTIKSNAFYGCTNLKTINVPWAEGAVANAPWGATNATINYNYTGG